MFLGFVYNIWYNVFSKKVMGASVEVRTLYWFPSPKHCFLHLLSIFTLSPLSSSPLSSIFTRFSWCSFWSSLYYKCHLLRCLSPPFRGLLGLLYLSPIFLCYRLHLWFWVWMEILIWCGCLWDIFYFSFYGLIF